jgi:hypothetical protein
MISRLAKSHGFLDPLDFLARLRRFAQPSEVAEPIELLRAGLVLHARGLINSRVIQHNLDWVWPFWVERQFDPLDDAFVPRAFSLTHINLTHRNWTAVGLPDCDCLPIVDPRGLVTPLWNGWSVDAWIIEPGGEPLLPSRADDVVQRLHLENGMAVETTTQSAQKALRSTVDATADDACPSCRMQFEAEDATNAWLALAIRPVNPEGVSFLHSIQWDRSSRSFLVDGDARLQLDNMPDRVCMSDYRRGDVFQHLEFKDPEQCVQAESIKCDVGMATAAALYRLDGTSRPATNARSRQAVVRVEARVPLDEAAGAANTSRERIEHRRASIAWSEMHSQQCELQVPDSRIGFLFESATRSLVLHSPGEIYPGPYTYKRFWFRDAAFILNALLMLGFVDRVGRAIERFPDRQTSFGYFRSQEGEWDSNGQAIWIIDRWRQASARTLSERLVRSVASGARWIERKRVSDNTADVHAGLMPAGFSAEHLGPNDYYYWDDFWSWAGLRSAAKILGDANDEAAAMQARDAADALSACIDRSIDQTAPNRDRIGVPASPYRRMDAGAVGSLATGYPLALWEARDPRLLDTVEFLLDECLVHGGFFQDMIHSGINPYLTLHLAQVLLRAGDQRQVDLVRAVAELASPTGQWPEAIHPRTRGGCMGDGQHVWASAEWVSIIRNWFVREEGDLLVLGSGLPERWLDGRQSMKLGRTATPFGRVTVEIECDGGQIQVRWKGDWHERPPIIEVRLPNREPKQISGKEKSVSLSSGAG